MKKHSNHENMVIAVAAGNTFRSLNKHGDRFTVLHWLFDNGFPITTKVHDFPREKNGSRAQIFGSRYVWNGNCRAIAAEGRGFAGRGSI